MSAVASVPEPAPELDELFSPTLTFEGEDTMKNTNRFGLIAAAATVLAIVVGIIAFVGGDDQGLETIDTPAETTTTVPDQEPGSGEAAAPDVDDLFGMWLSPRGGVWTITEGVIGVKGGYADEYTYVATDTTIEVIDPVCGPDVPGNYEWAIDGEEFALTLVSDECSWRPADLDNVRLRRAASDEQRAEDLRGVWLSSQGGLRSGVWTFSEDAIVVKGRAADEYTYLATDATIELIDADCGPDVPGTYEWAIAGDVFGLTLVSDDCGVGTDLDGVTFQRVDLDQQRAEDLLGVWEAADETLGTWRIGEGAISVTGGITALLYTATDTTIEFVDSECGGNRPGTYEWVIAGDVLGLTLVSDECNRSGSFSGAKFNRVE